MSYKAVHDSFWTDPKVKKMNPNLKFLYLYFITNPHNHYSGIYYLPIEIIQVETGLNKKTIKKGIDTLSKWYLIKYDMELSVVWVIKMAKYQVHGKKQKIGIANHFKDLHNCLLIKEFLELYKDLDIPYQYPLDGVCPPYHKEEGTEEGKGEEKGKGESAPEDIFVLPEWVNREAWEEFEQHRKIIRKSLSDLARKKALKILEGNSLGDQQKIIDYSVLGKYPALYPLKENDNGKKAPASAHEILHKVGKEMEGENDI